MRWNFEEEYGSAEFAAYEWTYWHESGEPLDDRPEKILVPLDRSLKGANRVLEIAEGLLKPGGEGILLHVIPPSSPRIVDLGYVPARELEKHERSRAATYLNYFAERLNSDRCRWRGEVVVARSVADGIAEVAARENVDLVAMYTHNRNGLTKWLKGSVSDRVRRYVSTEVRIVRAAEFAPAQ